MHFNNWMDVCARAGIDNAWMHSEKARLATAQKVVDLIAEYGFSAVNVRDLFTWVHDALEKWIPPTEILLQAAEAPDEYCFLSAMMVLQKRAEENLARSIAMRTPGTLGVLRGSEQA